MGESSSSLPINSWLNCTFEGAPFVFGLGLGLSLVLEPGSGTGVILTSFMVSVGPCSICLQSRSSLNFFVGGHGSFPAAAR